MKYILLGSMLILISGCATNSELIDNTLYGVERQKAIVAHVVSPRTNVQDLDEEFSEIPYTVQKNEANGDWDEERTYSDVFFDFTGVSGFIVYKTKNCYTFKVLLKKGRVVSTQVLKN